MAISYTPDWVGKQKFVDLIEGNNNLAIVSEGLLRDYEELSATPWNYTGLEDVDLTCEYIESLFFWNECIGIAEDSTGQYVLGATPVVIDLYNQPYTWIPRPTNVTLVNTDLIHIYDSITNPCMRIAIEPVCARIAEECIWQASALISANQNVIGMRAPITFVGVDSNAEMEYINSNLVDGRNLLYVKKAGIDVNVLDLKVQNFLDPLTGFADYMHSKILRKLGIDAPGTQKASGITQEEAVLMLAQVKGIREKNLKIREKLCEMINTTMGANVTVSVSDIYLDVNLDDDSDTDTNLDTDSSTNSNKENNGEK